MPAADLVRRSFSKGTAEKMAGQAKKRNRTVGAMNNRAEPPREPDLEADSELVEFKKAVRKARLEQQLAQVKAPVEIKKLLAAHEARVSDLMHLV